MVKQVGMGRGKTTRSAPGAWSDYLDSGEKLVWEGRPAKGVRVDTSGIVRSAFGVFFFGFAIFWTYMASQGTGLASEPSLSFFPLLGIPFLAIGFYMVFGHWFFNAYKRGKTRYALTEERMIIAESVFTRKLKSYPLRADTSLSMEEGELTSVYFAEELRRTKNGSRTVNIGFHLLPDGRDVYKMMRKIQKEKL